MSTKFFILLDFLYDCFNLQPFESTVLEDNSRVQFESTVRERVQLENTLMVMRARDLWLLAMFVGNSKMSMRL